MKKLIYFLFFLAPMVSLAQDSCPAEARAIVQAVGGCSSIDKDIYSNIYKKCCMLSAVPASVPSRPPTSSAPTTPPSALPPSRQLTPSQILSPKIAPPVYKPTPLPSTIGEKLPLLKPLPTATKPSPESKPQRSAIDFIFRILRLFLSR